MLTFSQEIHSEVFTVAGKIIKEHYTKVIINRPGVAGAVL